MTEPAPLSPTDRFALALDALCAAVAARIGHHAMTAALIVLIWKHVRRIKLRVLALAARIQAGTFRERPARPRGTRHEAVAKVPRPGPSLPRDFGWLIRLVPCHAACWAEEIRRVLAEPEMAALVAATPKVARLLRPLCHMLRLEAGLLPPPTVAATRSAEAPPRRRTAKRGPSRRRAPSPSKGASPTATVFYESFTVGGRPKDLSTA